MVELAVLAWPAMPDTRHAYIAPVLSRGIMVETDG
jgi:hypothetical protein